jgi:hypothetical protein
MITTLKEAPKRHESASLVRERDEFGLHGAALVRKSRHRPRD